MPDLYQVLGQSDPLAATLTTLYTVPASTETVTSALVACNRSATPTSIRVAVRPAGAAIANQHYLAYDMPIGANETITMILGMTLEATDVVSIYATLATVSFNLFGVEKS